MTTRRPEQQPDPKQERTIATETERNAPPDASPADPSISVRLYHALGPVLGALVLDAADFVTFGPVGLYVGFFVGAAVGWWLGNFYAYGTRTRWVVAILAGIYTTIPSTEFIPLATIVSACARFARPHTTD